MSRLRVLHCIASVVPSYGGPVFAARTLCQRLADQGVSMTVLATSTGNQETDKKNASFFGSQTEFVWISPLVRRFYWDPWIAAKIVPRLNDFDCFHIHGVFNGLS